MLSPGFAKYTVPKRGLDATRPCSSSFWPSAPRLAQTPSEQPNSERPGGARPGRVGALPAPAARARPGDHPGGGGMPSERPISGIALHRLSQICPRYPGPDPPARWEIPACFQVFPSAPSRIRTCGLLLRRDSDEVRSPTSATARIAKIPLGKGKSAPKTSGGRFKIHRARVILEWMKSGWRWPSPADGLCALRAPTGSHPRPGAPLGP
jgi:hypothetical protein